MITFSLQVPCLKCKALREIDPSELFNGLSTTTITFSRAEITATPKEWHCKCGCLNVLSAKIEVAKG
jgi:hypothetical protein